MKPKRLILAVLFAVILAASNQPGAGDGNEDQGKPAETKKQTSHIGSLSNQDRAPSFSSPQEEMHPNGDRNSHYPPYYRPEPSGGGPH